MSKIGVFDSGVGGKSVADAIQAALPDSEVLFINDPDNLPYGNKSPEQLRELAKPHLDYLVNQDCDLIVVACNTVSCTVLPAMKDNYEIPIVGMVPMVKTASAMTIVGTIAVCATPTTLASKRYNELKEEFAKDIRVIEPDCSDWALMIESNMVDQAKIKATIDDVCDKGADVIVLGCTHYHWIEDIIKKDAEGRARVIQPEPAIVAHVKELLEK